MGLKKITEIRKKKGITIEELSELSNVPISTIKKISAGITTNPSLDTVKALARALDCKLDDFDDNPKSILNTPEQRDILEKFIKLDKYGKETVSYIIERELKRTKSIEKRNQRIQELESTQHQNKVIVYPYYRKLASAGNGDYLFDDIPLETFEVDYDFAKDRGADFALGVNGDSMEDDINDGDVVLVKKQSSVNDNELGVFIIDGNCFIKIYDNGTLISSNPKYTDIKLTEYNNIICVGKVVGIIQPERNKFDLPIENADPDDEEYKHPIYRFAAHSGLKDTPETRKMTEKLAEFFKSQGDSKNNE